MANVQVVGNTFQNNQLPQSNSIAIVGAAFAYLEDNDFLYNGGTPEDYQIYILQDSYFGERFPDAVSDLNYWDHFGQTTAVLIDYTLKIQTDGNHFLGNWATFEGSYALA